MRKGRLARQRIYVLAFSLNQNLMLGTPTLVSFRWAVIEDEIWLSEFGILSQLDAAGTVGFRLYLANSTAPFDSSDVLRENIGSI